MNQRARTDLVYVVAIRLVWIATFKDDDHDDGHQDDDLTVHQDGSRTRHDSDSDDNSSIVQLSLQSHPMT